MVRSDLKNAPYNPRVIDGSERKKLERVLKKLGLLQSLVWNKQTGNLVSGHQRLSILDDLHGSSDYELDMDVVDLPLKQEIKANIAFNNEQAMGRFDEDLLAKLIVEDVGLEELEDIGFSIDDLRMRFDGTEHASLFTPPEPIAPDVAELGEMAAAGRDARAAAAESDEAGDELTPQETAKLNRDKMKLEHASRESGGMDDADTNITFVFGNRQEAAAVAMEIVGMDQAFIDGRKLAEKLGIALPKVTRG